MYTTRRKKFEVTITDGDREAVKRGCSDNSLASIDRRAVARAAGRAVFAETKSTAEALKSMTAGIPKGTLHAWMKAELKLAA